MPARHAYEELLHRSREQALLESCTALLNWDEETYMPRAGGGHRAEQLALLAGLHHAWATDPRIGELLSALEASDLISDQESPEAANVRELQRRHRRLVRLPRALVEEKARATTLGELAWVEARKRNDFASFRPYLERVVALKREQAECLGYTTCAYDALLEEYEPGMTERRLSALFEELLAGLMPLAQTLLEAAPRARRALPQTSFAVQQQRAFCQTVAAAVGYDFEGGRLDVAAHPFSATIGPGDCRITTRYDEHDFLDGLFTTLHEVGHALYEQGLDRAHAGTPLGEAASVGIHESQARLWENIVGRRLAFWQHFFPLAQAAFPAGLDNVALTDFHLAMNFVQATPIRVRADEVTYDLHILIRFELERALINKQLDVVDLPSAWCEAYRRHLGISPVSDAEGCMQDSHWVSGLIGYFPTYTLGNIYAAQLFACADQDAGGLDEAFARGDFTPLRSWLHQHVHRHGKRYLVNDLLERATGAAPSPRHLLNALSCKYRALYGL